VQLDLEPAVNENSTIVNTDKHTFVSGTIPKGVVQLDLEPAVNENSTIVDIKDRVLGSLWNEPEPRKAVSFYGTAGVFVNRCGWEMA
jgi:hypothetical protein